MGLRADELTAVHFVLDADHAARLQQRWEDFNQDTPLRLIDCPDRHLSRAAQELVPEALDEHPDTDERQNNEVTVLLPRRTYAPLVGRLLHDRTADKMARAVTRIPGAIALIVPYDTGSRIAQATSDGFEQRIARRVSHVLTRISGIEEHEHPQGRPAVIAVARLVPGRRATIEGRVSQVEDIAEGLQTSRSLLVGDGSGEVRVILHPGHGDAIEPGHLLRITAEARLNGSEPMSMVDPTYQVVENRGSDVL